MYTYGSPPYRASNSPFTQKTNNSNDNNNNNNNNNRINLSYNTV